MPRISLAGFKDPVRRPRLIIWAGTLVILVALVMIGALAATSTNWFCANGCHKVQDDTIRAFQSSDHKNLACVSCHLPVGADPVTFVLHKAEALGELYLTVTNQFKLPLNPEDELALNAKVMGDVQCTQCHSPNRQVTPSRGIIINHEIHTKNGITCTTCHNRVAHPENFKLSLQGNRKHEDYMKMDACFRCHGQEPGAKAPGACSVCHTKDFELKPASHFQPDFYQKGGDSSGHAKLAVEDYKRVEDFKAEQVSKEGESKESADLVKVEPLGRVSYCATCHNTQRFCSSCHGLAMPHPSDFKKNHGELGKSKPQVCQNCHGTKAGATEFCNACHHKDGDPNKPWIPQHFKVVRDKGVQPCLDCHSPKFCAECHVSKIK